MQPAPPKITDVEVVAAQPTDADSAAIARLSAESNRSLSPVVYVVKVRLKNKPQPASMAWALYVNDVLIPKYWEYDEGIYFTVLEPRFFDDHKGKRLRFSQNGLDYYDTGVKLTAPKSPPVESGSKDKDARGKASKRRTARRNTLQLPLQSDVLK